MRAGTIRALSVATLSTSLAIPAYAAVTTDSTNLRNMVTVAGIRAHQRALQDIAGVNGGTRASGTPGFSRSADYVAGLLDADYDVTRQHFTFPSSKS